MKMVDKPQAVAFVVVTTINVLLLLYAFRGLPSHLPGSGLEMRAYDLATSVGRSLPSFLVYFVLTIADLLRGRPRRILGWLCCYVATVLVLFLLSLLGASTNSGL
jgi:hypothetical protein